VRHAAPDVAWVLEPVRGSELGVSLMRMAAPAVSPLMLRPIVVLFPGWLGGGLSFGIGFQSVSAFSLFCVALAVDACFSQVVVAPRWCLASCAFDGIESQGLAKPCSTDLSVPPETEAEPVVS